MTNIEITPREVKDLLASDPKVLFVDVREKWNTIRPASPAPC